MKLIILQISITFVISSKVLESPLELIHLAGFEGEEHQVVTEDGYKIKIHRVFAKKENEIDKNISKPPCFIMHGLLGSSKTFLLSKDSLAFYLAENGFEVWLGNSRGNQFGLEHEKFDVNSSEFWNFSFHEVGFYDLPAMIDKMLSASGSERGFYVGHSQGTVSLLVLLSTRPEYNNKIIQAHLSAVPVFLSNIPNPLIRTQAKKFVRKFNVNGKLNSSQVFDFLKPFSEEFCDPDQPLKFITCVFFYFTFFGGNIYHVEVNPKLLALQIRHMSTTVSENQISHFAQLVESGKFQRFDREKIKNKTEIESYELRKVSVKIFIYCGFGDALVAVKDCSRVKDELPNIGDLHVFKNYNHMDFVYGSNAKKDYYTKILKEFKKFLHE